MVCHACNFARNPSIEVLDPFALVHEVTALEQTIAPLEVVWLQQRAAEGLPLDFIEDDESNTPYPILVLKKMVLSQTEVEIVNERERSRSVYFMGL